MHLLTYSDAVETARSFTASNRKVVVLRRHGVSLHAVTCLKQRHALCHGTALLDALPAAQRTYITARIHGARWSYFHRTDLAGWCAFSAPLIDAYDANENARMAVASGGTRMSALASGRLGGRNIYRSW